MVNALKICGIVRVVWRRFNTLHSNSKKYLISSKFSEHILILGTIDCMDLVNYKKQLCSFHSCLLVLCEAGHLKA